MGVVIKSNINFFSAVISRLPEVQHRRPDNGSPMSDSTQKKLGPRIIVYQLSEISLGVPSAVVYNLDVRNISLTNRTILTVKYC